MLKGLTNAVSPDIAQCELTFIEPRPINYELAVQQHDEYCRLLRRLGVIVENLAVNISYPDSCFIEDTAIILNEFVILASMGSPSRSGESNAIGNALSKSRAVARIELPAKIEGGDVLRIDRKFFVGLSSRTNLQGIKELTRLVEPFGYKVCPVPVRHCLHLKTACTSLDDDTLLVNPEWVDVGYLEGFNILATAYDEPWGANVLSLSDTIILALDFPKTAELINKAGKKIETLDISEFRKAEAGLTCLSLIFQEPDH